MPSPSSARTSLVIVWLMCPNWYQTLLGKITFHITKKQKLRAAEVTLSSFPRMASKAHDEVPGALSSMAAQDWTSNGYAKLHAGFWKLPALQNSICSVAQSGLSKGRSVLFAKSAVETNVGSQNFNSKNKLVFTFHSKLLYECLLGAGHMTSSDLKSWWSTQTLF